MTKGASKIVPAPQWKKQATEWPTVWLFLVIVVVAALSTYSALQLDPLYWPIFILINTLCVYSVFTVMHEASHKNISREYPRMEYAMGVVSGLMYHGAYEQFVPIHLRHHAKVNLEGEDPDLHAKGPLGVLKFLFWGITLGVYSDFFWKKGMYSKNKFWAVFLPYLFIVSVYIAGFYYAFVSELLLFWLVPSFFGVILTVYIFDHLPHHPHNDAGKYTNASVYPRKGIDWLFFMQSHHLIHHLWPSIPWYRYRNCYAQRREELLSMGAREH